MIFIISDNADLSSCEVIDWLSFSKENNYVLSNSMRVNFKKMDVFGEITFEINDVLFNTKEIKSIWYRRGFIRLNTGAKINSISKEIDGILSLFLKQEKKWLGNYLYYKLFSKKSLGNFNLMDVDKIIVNEISKKNNLKIPNSYIVTNKKDLLSIVGDTNDFITKTIIPGLDGDSENYEISGYTELIDDEFLNKIPDNFAPSLIQEKIDKKFEIRTFFIEDNFYSMAIFSQNDKQTEVDFRHYNDELPNRKIPFKLPNEIEKKAQAVMKEIGLNCGSIDFIYGKDKKYYFLEVNPIGQYGMTSYPCNYYLDEKIAQFLAH